MYSMEDYFQFGMAIFYAAFVGGLFEIYRPGMEAELEKKLGRRLTTDERSYLIRELILRIQVERQQKQANQWIQHQVDREIIHDFVWR